MPDGTRMMTLNLLLLQLVDGRLLQTFLWLRQEAQNRPQLQRGAMLAEASEGEGGFRMQRKMEMGEAGEEAVVR